MRGHSTNAEEHLWRFLRRKNLGTRFRRQVTLGRYIADFLSFRPKVLIEVDGSQHANNPYDRRRDAFFRDEGFVVLRFWNWEVLRNVDGVLERILRTLAELSD